MNRCRHPAHPHCTVWVMPGEPACAHGHLQPDAGQATAAAAPEPEPAAALPIEPPAAIVPGALPPQRARLHVSGFDPRAAGGRQVLKLELRGMPDDCAPEACLLAASRLRLDGGAQHRFTRTARGEWLPVFLEFSSRGLEHGQYRIELELHSRVQGPAAARAWLATLLVLVPRPDASLQEIHQTFLATHKNVRVNAVDASIARVQARLGGAGGSSVGIDVNAANAGIAHLDLDAECGKIDLGLASIAWDEELLELDPPSARHAAPDEFADHTDSVRLVRPHGPAAGVSHLCPASSACLMLDTRPDLAQHTAPPVRHLRLFALDECVLGRFEPGAAQADLLLMHHGADGPATGGLTRRISARHALIRRGPDGFVIEDVSRYGLLADGAWAGKHVLLPLREGMRIELTASIPGVAVLEVGPLLANGIVLYRRDAGSDYEAFCLLDPEIDPERDPRDGDQHDGDGHGSAAGIQAPGLPLLFHRDGGFWLRNRPGAVATPLTPARRPDWPGALRFSARAYLDMRGAGAATPPAGAQRAPAPG